MVTVSDIAARTELEPAAVARALEALDPDYVDFRKTTTGGDPTFWYVLKVTPQARRVVGQWPTPDSFVTRLAEELSAAASQEDDAERKGLLSYAARLVGDTLREAAVRAAGQVLAPAIGSVPPASPPAAATPPAPISGPAPAMAAPAPLRPLPVTVAPEEPPAGEQPDPPPGLDPADPAEPDTLDSSPATTPSWPPVLAVVRSGPDPAAGPSAGPAGPGPVTSA